MTNSTTDDPEYIDPNALVPFDETLEWEGRPAWRIRWREDFSLVQAGFGAIGCVFSAIWIAMASSALFWPAFGSIIFLACFYLVALRPVGQAWVRSRTEYAMTERAVYMVTRTLGITRRRRVSYANMTTPPELRETDPPSLIFGEENEVIFTVGSGPDAYEHTRRKEFGFFFIDDAPALLRRITPRLSGN